MLINALRAGSLVIPGPFSSLQTGSGLYLRRMRTSALACALPLWSALAAALALCFWPALVARAAAPRPAGPVIQVGHVNGEITAITVRYVGRMVDHAERRGAEALVLTLDTPGGLDSAMREVVQRLLRSSVPVVVYVFPPGVSSVSTSASAPRRSA